MKSTTYHVRTRKGTLCGTFDRYDRAKTFRDVESRRIGIPLVLFEVRHFERELAV